MSMTFLPCLDLVDLNYLTMLTCWHPAFVELASIFLVCLDLLDLNYLTKLACQHLACLDPACLVLARRFPWLNLLGLTFFLNGVTCLTWLGLFDLSYLTWLDMLFCRVYFSCVYIHISRRICDGESSSGTRSSWGWPVTSCFLHCKMIDATGKRERTKKLAGAPKVPNTKVCCKGPNTAKLSGAAHVVWRKATALKGLKPLLLHQLMLQHQQQVVQHQQQHQQQMLQHQHQMLLRMISLSLGQQYHQEFLHWPSAFTAPYAYRVSCFFWFNFFWKVTPQDSCFVSFHFFRSQSPVFLLSGKWIPREFWCSNDGRSNVGAGNDSRRPGGMESGFIPYRATRAIWCGNVYFASSSSSEYVGEHVGCYDGGSACSTVMPPTPPPAEDPRAKPKAKPKGKAKPKAKGKAKAKGNMQQIRRLSKQRNDWACASQPSASSWGEKKGAWNASGVGWVFWWFFLVQNIFQEPLHSCFFMISWSRLCFRSYLHSCFFIDFLHKCFFRSFLHSCQVSVLQWSVHHLCQIMFGLVGFGSEPI